MDGLRDGSSSVGSTRSMPSWYSNRVRSVSRHISAGRRHAEGSATQQLEAVAFKAEFVRKPGMYLAAVGDLLARDDEKSTIGLLRCTSNNLVVAKYALCDRAAK